MHCPAREGGLASGDTSDLVLDFGSAVSFTNSFNYRGFILHRDLSNHHGVDARIKKASQSFGALLDRVFSSKDVPGRLKGKVFKGGLLAVLLYGSESGVPRPSPPRACATGTTSAPARCVAWL